MQTVITAVFASTPHQDQGKSYANREFERRPATRANLTFFSMKCTLTLAFNKKENNGNPRSNVTAIY